MQLIIIKFYEVLTLNVKVNIQWLQSIQSQVKMSEQIEIIIGNVVHYKSIYWPSNLL